MPAPSHRMSHTPEYQAWSNMKQRCFNPSYPMYRWYGARGITVCPEWTASFEEFLRDMGLRPSPELSIDRIDVNGNYEPSNCRWTTRFVQDRNTTNIIRLTIEGKEYLAVDLAQSVGLKTDTVVSRAKKGMTLEQVLYKGRHGFPNKNKGKKRTDLPIITHCKSGHEFTPENTRLDKKGSRVCVACRRISWTKQNRKRQIALLRKNYVGD